MIQTIREHLNAGRRARAIDVVYGTLDELLRGGEFAKATEVLRALCAHDMPLCILLSAITITMSWREQTGDARVETIARARSLAIAEGGEGKAGSALAGLE